MRQISSQLEGSVESTIPKKPSSSCVLGQPPVLNGTHWFLNVTAVVVSVGLFVVAVVGVGLIVVVDGLVVLGVVGGYAVNTSGSGVWVGSFGLILQHSLPK